MGDPTLAEARKVAEGAYWPFRRVVEVDQVDGCEHTDDNSSMVCCNCEQEILVRVLAPRILAYAERVRAPLLTAILPFADDVMPRTAERALQALARLRQSREDLKGSNLHNYARAEAAEAEASRLREENERLEGETRVLIGCPCHCHQANWNDTLHRDCRECVRGTATPTAVDHDHEWALWFEKWTATLDTLSSVSAQLSEAQQQLGNLLAIIFRDGGEKAATYATPGEAVKAAHQVWGEAQQRVEALTKALRAQADLESHFSVCRKCGAFRESDPNLCADGKHLRMLAVNQRGAALSEEPKPSARPEASTPETRRQDPYSGADCGYDGEAD